MVQQLLTWIDRKSEKQLTLLGIVALLLSTLFATIAQTHYDGILDMHPTTETLPFYIVLSEILINVLTLSLILWGVASFWSNKAVNVGPLFNRQLLARSPLLFPPLLFFLLPIKKDLFLLTQKWVNTGGISDISLNVVIQVISIILLSFYALYLFIRLSFNGFIVAGNLQNKRVKLSFFGAVLLAEMISKWIIIRLFIAES